MRTTDFELHSFLKPKPEIEELQNDIKYTGLTQDGLYSYLKVIDGEAVVFAIEPDEWKDLKIIYTHAQAKEMEPKNIRARLQLKEKAKAKKQNIETIEKLDQVIKNLS